MNKIRKEIELPEATEKWGWKYHHLGIPTNKIMPDEKYLPQYKFYHSGFPTSPFGIEWMRFEEDCTIHPLIQKVPHLAFEVEDLELELRHRDLKIITPPGSPMEGVRVVMVEHNGAPIELLEFKRD